MFKILIKYVIIIKKIGDEMIIVDTNISEQNYRNLVEEQKVGNMIYQISDSYAPELDFINKKISIAYIDENKVNDYATIHGLDFSDGIVKSYYLIEDNKRSTHDGKYLEDPMGYYKEVIEAFEKLINSDISEFTSKALEVFKEIKNQVVMADNKKCNIK